MDIDTLRHLCMLGKLRYSEEELSVLKAEMTDIVALMDGIRELDLEYDDTADNDSISYDKVREDVPSHSLSQGELLSNAVSRDGCFVVPKVVE